MSYPDRTQGAERTAIPRSRQASRRRAGTLAAPRPRQCRGWTAIALTLGLALLAAGCVRFTYDETPTAVTSAAPAPTPATVTVGATPQTPLHGTETEDPTPTPVPTISGPTVLRIEPSVVELAVGETQSVQVWLDNVERLQGIEIQIGFEPRYVRIEDADPEAAGVQIGAGVLPMPAHAGQNEVDNGKGLIGYQAAQAPGAPASGSGVVASFVARGVAEGGSPLQFSAVELRDPDGEPLPAPQQVDAMVVVGAGSAAPGRTPEPRPTAVPARPAPAEAVRHTVQPGENLFRISLRYGTTVEAIVAANHLPDGGSVQAGQVLVIPAGRPEGAGTYVVQPGDTLFSIAHRCGTTVETLAALNGIASPYTIEVGQVLIVAP